ncbi:uncharacterized protein BO97DRAFT_216161 [Aspergillus homomorphus CBS 101889]|uniref:Uncharacterized protein n=1 Tax=Aspergillus homomorphus (strain CBS 101889) TaxID=1450537 RepID=A0A395I6B7_ASPHC|nr:hypothetical protein BO97DRAFT_216161 [Aspergillus homomorphus CBS 101889]RAL15557.1 hypothetical protein BO97DRAFT_216161 [Aspergillus homomorphus CBS 101889]
MATTPPPPSRLRMPPTPRHGAKYDDYEPYSTRFSARLASQRSSRESQTTPPPSFPSTRESSKLPKKQHAPESATLSPPGSAQISPRKQKSGRFAGTHSLQYSTLDDADPFNTEPSHTHPPPFLRPTLTEGMLPTPAKTPRKKAVADVGSTARVLFPPPPSSSSRRKSKKHTGFSLDSFTEDHGQSGTEIKIYTDSRDRVPELDESEGNPFYKKPSSNTSTRTSRRKEMARDKEVNESVKREDGMFYVFRGKKLFRKFTDDVESCDEDDDDDLGLLAARPDLIDESLTASLRPLTRSSIKPRVLFRSAASEEQQDSTGDADEEAATDIDEHVFDTEAEETEDADLDHDIVQRPVTPPLKTTTTTPPSPGGTVRSLRTRGKRDDTEQGETPSTSGPETKRKRVNPFDGWLRRKQTPAVIGTKAKKRDADAAASPGGPAPKKTRGNRATASIS